jgi:putative phosphoribosyl transferase
LHRTRDDRLSQRAREPELVLNDDVISLAGVSRRYIEEEAKKELAEIERRQRVYLHGRARVPLEGREVIVVDDGIATGASVRAALTALRRKKPNLLVLGFRSRRSAPLTRRTARSMRSSA